MLLGEQGGQSQAGRQSAVHVTEGRRAVVRAGDQRAVRQAGGRQAAAAALKAYILLNGRCKHIYAWLLVPAGS